MLATLLRSFSEWMLAALGVLALAALLWWLSRRWSKKGVAAGAFALALGLVGCRSAKPEAEKKDKAPATATSPGDATGTAASTGDATGTAAPTGDATGTAAPAGELATLTAQAEWKSFKALWKRIDEVPMLTGPPGGGSVDLSQDLEAQQQGLAKLAEGGHLDQGLAETLGVVLRERVEYVGGSCQKLMIMHRLPTPGEEAACSIATQLEKRVDALLALREAGKVGDDTFRTALDAIVEQVEVVALMNLPGLPVTPPMAMGAAQSVPEMLREMKAVLAKTKSTGDDKPGKRLALFEANLPKLRQLVAELER